MHSRLVNPVTVSGLGKVYNSMIRRILFIFLFTALAWAEPFGTWECEATTGDGERIPYTLNVRKSDAGLDVSIRSSRGEIKLPSAKLDGDNLTFTVEVDSEPYSVKLTFSGDTVRGEWKGAGATGPMSGKRSTVK
ncbi:MAG: hypothetical protein JNN08_31090 [Bryobacterales bacterium]|nr:hypothetical protein [Bryobacterales bacterium]